MNTLNFKTYKEFEKEMIDDLDIQEKLEIYNSFCQYNNDYDSMLYKNDEDFFNDAFEGDFNALVSAIVCGDYNSKDDYVKLDGDGDLRGYYSLSEALYDKFTDDELIDFTMRYESINVKDLYDLYIKDTIVEAKESMSPEEFSEALKEYTSEEMIKKYPEVCDNIDCNYSDFILDEKDTDKSKEIDDDFER